MTESRFPDAPTQIKTLRVERRGYPVPYFAEWIDGEPEFRAVDPRKMERAAREGLCWVCGIRNSGAKAFVLGPMCGITRVNPEPPNHIVCARFAATSCPFLSQPMAKRNARDLPGHEPPSGIMIARNPGVVAVWITSTYRMAREPEGGFLFHVGTPTRIEWYAHGRKATRDEIMRSVETGIPNLIKMAELDELAGHKNSMELLRKMTERFLKLVPTE